MRAGTKIFTWDEYHCIITGGEKYVFNNEKRAEYMRQHYLRRVKPVNDMVEKHHAKQVKTIKNAKMDNDIPTIGFINGSAGT